jgi:hypothetical protein
MIFMFNNNNNNNLMKITFCSVYINEFTLINIVPQCVKMREREREREGGREKREKGYLYLEINGHIILVYNPFVPFCVGSLKG